MPIQITPSLVRDVNMLTGSKRPSSKENDFRGIVLPGEIVFTSGANLITGHGTYRLDEMGGVTDTLVTSSNMDQSEHPTEQTTTLPMYASLAGRMKSVNKLVYVEPPNTRYPGNVGDTVVGRIVEVEQKRWKVDVNSYRLANLSLANVKLPTGELRRKSEDDERAMRSFMREGDLIVAEVREIYRDGSLQLHMPGMRTGRLGEGQVLRLPPSLIRRQKIHRHQLVVPGGVGTSEMLDESQGVSRQNVNIGLILGCNGLVWIGPARGMDLGAHLGSMIATAELAPWKSSEMMGERVAVGRVRNAVLALAACGHVVWETAILAACEASFVEEAQEEMCYDNSDDDNGAPITRLLMPDQQRHLVDLVIAKLAAG
ncbi:unnamed protein product [Hymenolepis diminuta]|uniref:KH_dom_type_1 domain-containing protein n=1 Tax=Hymenolepis diminuta TaxID=6216 RepID=A0A0R3SS05_HYMDI|nr:unnamed protein product [Hymenolepis diminuta]VUZ42893.1 unnamed protein product [Hymenolepis diminuta]